MAWIQSHTNVERHKKTLITADELDIPVVYLSGHLHALWHSALEQVEDGNLAGLSARMIARFAQFPGDPEEFVAALRKHGWIDGDLLHDWLDYAGNYLAAKYRTGNPARLQAIYDLHGRARTEGRRPDNSANSKEGRSSQTKDRLKSDSSRSKDEIISISESLRDSDISVYKDSTVLVTNSESSEGSAEGRGAEVAEPNLPALSSAQVPANPKRDRRGKNPHPWPEPFVISDNLRRWAESEGLPSPESELDAFHDWAISKNAVYSNWEAAFRTRLRNTRKFGASYGPHGNNSDPSQRLEEQVKAALNTPLKRRKK